MKKDKKLIPKGLYCERDGQKCPYWSIEPGRREQENGYCAYLGKSDWDRNEEMGMLEVRTGDGKFSYEESAHELGASLLWDCVKECGIKDDVKYETWTSWKES